MLLQFDENMTRLLQSYKEFEGRIVMVKPAYLQSSFKNRPLHLQSTFENPLSDLQSTIENQPQSILSALENRIEIFSGKGKTEKDLSQWIRNTYKVIIEMKIFIFLIYFK